MTKTAVITGGMGSPPLTSWARTIASYWRASTRGIDRAVSEFADITDRAARNECPHRPDRAAAAR
ncbi:hypothetical protein [Arthrobacter sp. NPDC056493]|uniref:hypothetical protein n=1 Tax=Arthrobacter sp. NPDC056493 TaxID=3345839 RepID=UPI00366C701B